MLEIERRRLTLAGHGASELNTLMKRVEEFYSGYLLDRVAPREILRGDYASHEAAFEGKSLPFDDRVAQRIGQWFERHR